MRLLVDSSAWVAMEVAEDQNHDRAMACWHGLLPEMHRLLVSTWILSETLTHLSRRLGSEHAFRWGRRILDSANAEIVWGDAEMASRILLGMRQRGEHKFSFADAASWVIAREYSADAVFAFDRHLRIPGLPFLPEDGGWQVRERPGRYRVGPRRRRIRRISSITATHS